MSSHTRRLTETIRIAENTAKALRSTARDNEYQRGLYNGFILIMSLLNGLEYKPIEKDQKEDAT